MSTEIIQKQVEETHCDIGAGVADCVGTKPKEGAERELWGYVTFEIYSHQTRLDACAPCLRALANMGPRTPKALQRWMMYGTGGGRPDRNMWEVINDASTQEQGGKT